MEELERERKAHEVSRESDRYKVIVKTKGSQPVICHDETLNHELANKTVKRNEQYLKSLKDLTISHSKDIMLTS